MDISRKRLLVSGILCMLYLVANTLFMGFSLSTTIVVSAVYFLFNVSVDVRKLIVAFLPIILFVLIYDFMRVYPNYLVNSIDTKDVYELEKSLFGISTPEGRLIPCEYFKQNHWGVLDFMSGIFYLCWVPLPIIYGIYLYFTRRRDLCLRFTTAFLIVNLIGFAGYYIHPAAPPWYVMKYGFEPILNTPGDVAGLGRFDEMTGLGIFDSLYSRNSNVFAAIPSLHSAYMVIAFYYSLKAKYPNFLRVIFGIIMLGIWFTAVYSAHHYIIDAILGASCAVLGIFIFEKILMKWGAFNRFITKYTAYIS